MRIVPLLIVGIVGLASWTTRLPASDAVVSIVLSDSMDAPMARWSNHYDGGADTIYARVVVDSISEGIVRGANLRLVARALDRNEAMDLLPRELTQWEYLDPEIPGLEEFADSNGFEVPVVIGEWKVPLPTGLVVLLDVMPTPYEPHTPMLLAASGEITSIRAKSAGIHYGNDRVISFPIPTPTFDIDDGAPVVPSHVGLWLPSEFLPATGEADLDVSDIGSSELRSLLDSIQVVAIHRPLAGLPNPSTIGLLIPSMPNLTGYIDVEYGANVEPAEIAHRIHNSLWNVISSVSPITASMVMDDTPDDEEYNDPSDPLWHLHKIRMDDVWASAPEVAQREPPSWRIGIVDSGLEFRHDEFGGSWGHKVVDGYHFGLGIPYPFYDHAPECSPPHGTEVAGTLAALTNNGCLTSNDEWDIASVAGGWGYGTEGVPGCDDEGPHSVGPRLAIYSWWSEDCGAIQDAPNVVLAAFSMASDPTDGNCGIVNASFHFGGLGAKETMRRAAAVVYKRGALLCCAAGKEGQDGDVYPVFPAFVPDRHMVMTVAGTTETDAWYAQSNFGSAVDVAAPATDIVTTGVSYPSGHVSPVFDLRTVEGTSLSTPMVAGLAGLVKQSESELHVEMMPDDIQEIIKLGADDVQGVGWDEYSGTGRINAATTLNLLHDPYEYRQTETTIENLVDILPTGVAFRTFPGAPFGDAPVRATGFVVEFLVPWPFEVDDGYLHKVWMVGGRTKGLSNLDPNYSEGRGSVLDPDDTNGSPMSTFVYYIETSSGGTDPTYQDWGWWPADPFHCKIGYSILGVPVSMPAATEGDSDIRGAEVRVLGSPSANPRIVCAGPSAASTGWGTIVDVNGRVVARIFGRLENGESVFSVRDLPGGVYYVRISQHGKREAVRRVTVVR